MDSTVLSSWGGKLGESGSALGLGPGWQCWFYLMKLLGFCFGTTALIRMVQVLQGPVLFSRPFHASRWDKPLGTAGLSLSPTAPGLCIHFLLHLLASTHQLLAVVIGTSWWEMGS